MSAINIELLLLLNSFLYLLILIATIANLHIRAIDRLAKRLCSKTTKQPVASSNIETMDNASIDSPGQYVGVSCLTVQVLKVVAL